MGALYFLVSFRVPLEMGGHCHMGERGVGAWAKGIHHPCGRLSRKQTKLQEHACN